MVLRELSRYTEEEVLHEGCISSDNSYGFLGRLKRYFHRTREEAVNMLFKRENEIKTTLMMKVA